MGVFDFLKKKPPPRRVLTLGNLEGGGVGKELGFVAVYFNACGYHRLRDNMLAFLHRSKWMEGRLLVVELAYGDKPFELTGKHVNLLQLRSDSILWHKENLINLGTQILRERGFENVGWLDGDTDILGDGEAWYYKCCKALRRSNLVQCFESVDHRYDELTLSGLGSVAEYLEPGSEPLSCYKSGLAWAVRGAIWDACGWFDLSILGSGDRLAYVAALPESRVPLPEAEDIMQFRGPLMVPYKLAWREWAAQWRCLVAGKLDYVPGVTMRAHAHGSRADRAYYPREHRMQEIGFDPARDVRRDANGVLEWTPQAPPELPEYIAEYLRSRNEDGEFLTTESTKNTKKELGNMNIKNPNILCMLCGLCDLCG